jgi:hypothetical protein
MPFYKFKVVKSQVGDELPDLNEQAFLWIGELADAFPEKEFLLLFSGVFDKSKEAVLEFQCDQPLEVSEVADILFEEDQFHEKSVRVWPSDEEQIIEVWFSGLNEPEMVRIF